MNRDRSSKKNQILRLCSGGARQRARSSQKVTGIRLAYQVLYYAQHPAGHKLKFSSEMSGSPVAIAFLIIAAYVYCDVRIITNLFYDPALSKAGKNFFRNVLIYFHFTGIKKYI